MRKYSDMWHTKLNTPVLTSDLFPRKRLIAQLENLESVALHIAFSSCRLWKKCAYQPMDKNYRKCYRMDFVR